MVKPGRGEEVHCIEAHLSLKIKPFKPEHWGLRSTEILGENSLAADPLGWKGNLLRACPVPLHVVVQRVSEVSLPPLSLILQK